MMTVMKNDRISNTHQRTKSNSVILMASVNQYWLSWKEKDKLELQKDCYKKMTCW